MAIQTVCFFLLVSSCLCQGSPLQPAIGFFWHIADMHWDPTYDSQNEALSCNPVTNGNSFGKYGDFRCDPPWELINSSVYAMRDIKPDVDFLIWTGDDTPHIYNDTILNKGAVAEIVRRQSSVLQEVFPDKVVYSSLGNHDWSPKDQLPPKADPFYEVIAGEWEPWMDEQANVTFLKAGYYSMVSQPGIRMVMLNTNLYYTSNHLTEAMPDPGNQLQWLDDVMTQAAKDSEQVMIVAHVPPGVFEKHYNKTWYYPHYNKLLLGLLVKHSGVIAGMYMAHHHTDSYRIVYNQQGDPVSSIFLGPSVSPWETTLPGVMGGPGNNPSIRLVEYDRTTGRVVDIHQYYMNLTAANSQEKAAWTLEYSAREYFGLSELSPASLDELTTKMETDNDMFSKYYRANGVLYDPTEVWSEQMRLVHLCAIKHLDFDEYYRCVEPKETGAGVSFHRRGSWVVTSAALAAFTLSLWISRNDS